LETVAEFGEASAGLVAWDLCVSDDELRPVWDQAVSERLLEPVRRCEQTGEAMYRVIPLPSPPNSEASYGCASARGAAPPAS
jgi:hypothetical protein